MPFYADYVYYDGHDASRAIVRRKKQASCARYAQGSHYSIRPGSMTVAYALTDRAFEIVDYIVDFDVYNSRTQQRSQGAARIRVVFDTR